MPRHAPNLLRSRPILSTIVLVSILLGGLLLRSGNKSIRPVPATDQVAGTATDADRARDVDPSDGNAAETGRSQHGLAEPSVSGKVDHANGALSELRRLPGDVYESPAGLLYAPGSREGHRLKHVLLHTSDQPSRPNSHGVFLGGRDGALATIDQAFQIAQQKGPRVRLQTEGRRTVYTVDLHKKIGYVGGLEGNRKGNPPASHVRLVLEGKYVITAFPVTP